MIGTLWTLAVTILSLSETRSVSPVVKNLTFDLGTDVNLTCSDKMRNGTIYVIWKIQKYNYCEIGFTNSDNETDSCRDGKSLRHRSSSRPYLHIPNLSTSDLGVYKCEWVYSGGVENYMINLAVGVRPVVSVWLKKRANKTVAVCKAERGKPAANITWNYPGKQQSFTKLESDGSFTVEGELEVNEDVDPRNLSCIVDDTHWQMNVEIVEVKPIRSLFLLHITVAVVFVFLLGIACFALKKLAPSKRCRQSDAASSKSPPAEDVEEVEPYASYVQRVNSIYNTSADLKNLAYASH